ncbi:MAG TPA: ribosome recycling factor [Bdellovibrionota bacterium]|nr:ribosome recycling factor [Bdellovibrionota bacterium]
MSELVLNKLKEKMQKTIEALKNDLKKVRTGRASTHLLEGVKVDAYGTQCPINQVATISIPESRLLVIQPFDPNILSSIEKAIKEANLGFNPTNDGKVVRIAMPPLTEERRKELVKVIKAQAEEGRVAVRHQRREANEEVKALEKQKTLSEDDARVLQKKVQDLTDQFIAEIDKIALSKEKEILQV